MSVPPDQTSDSERFNTWVRAHGRAVRGYLLAQVRRADVADELAQEVFLRAWQARSRYHEQGTLRAYLIRIADRLACDRVRRNGRDKNLSGNDWPETQLARPDADPVHSVMARETAEQLALALNQLSPSQRRVILLRYYGQMSFTEIADILQTPLNTVLSHCHRALEQLRKILGGKMP